VIHPRPRPPSPSQDLMSCFEMADYTLDPIFQTEALVVEVVDELESVDEEMSDGVTGTLRHVEDWDIEDENSVGSYRDVGYVEKRTLEATVTRKRESLGTGEDIKGTLCHCASLQFKNSRPPSASKRQRTL
jgi:hypothetical protein